MRRTAYALAALALVAPLVAWAAEAVPTADVDPLAGLGLLLGGFAAGARGWDAWAGRKAQTLTEADVRRLVAEVVAAHPAHVDEALLARSISDAITTRMRPMAQAIGVTLDGELTDGGRLAQIGAVHLSQQRLETEFATLRRGIETPIAELTGEFVALRRAIKEG